MRGKEVKQVLENYCGECISCDTCLNACSLLENAQISLLDIARRALDGNASQEIIDLVQRCALCGLCDQACPANLRPAEMIAAARIVLVDQGKINFEDYDVMLMDRDWNSFSLYRETYDIHYSDLERKTYETLFFPGCSLATFSPELTRAVYGWLEDRGMSLGFSDLCCGKPLADIGLKSRAAWLRGYFENQMHEAGATTLISACPNCYYQLSGSLENIRVVSLYHLMREAGMRVNHADRLTIHDSCPDRYDLFFAKDLRALLPAENMVEMEHHKGTTICCGSGGIVSMIDSDVCQQRAQQRLQEFTASGAERMVTACISCAHRLARADTDAPVSHFLELAFDIPVDYARIQANLQAMWEGAQGEINLKRLAQARIIPAKV